MSEGFDLESLVNLEQTFYEGGFDDGFAHGRIHGLIEGRALGKAKGFEMWEELGFYEGFAHMWKAIYEKQSRNDDRAMNHARRLLELIEQFPRANPSVSDTREEVDILKLFQQIRSRYKALCSALGVRSSLRYSDQSQDSDEVVDPAVPKGNSGRVWKIDNGPRPVTGHAFDF